MVGEASLLHISGPDIQQLFAQAAGVGKNVGAIVGFAVVGVAVVGVNVGVNKQVSSQFAVYQGLPPF